MMIAVAAGGTVYYGTKGLNRYSRFGPEYNSRPIKWSLMTKIGQFMTKSVILEYNFIIKPASYYQSFNYSIVNGTVIVYT